MTDPDIIVRPDHFLRYLREHRGLRGAQTRLPPKAAIVFGGEDFRALRKAVGGTNKPWTRWLCVGTRGRTRIAVARTPIGAPATAITMEEMAALGARTFLTFGACGSLVRQVHVGDVVLPAFGVSDEGTSRHYGGPPRPQPDRGLRQALAAACRRRTLPYREGGTWTMDAAYRESRRRARSLATQGVIAVEMEASAVWSIARHHGLRAASLFVVSDELGGDGWNPGFRDPRFLQGKRRALQAIVDVLARQGP